jgi:hypothetical protein
MDTSKTADSMIATCGHNEMVATGNMTFVWKCAKCGYVYGTPNTEISNDGLHQRQIRRPCMGEQTSSASA